MAVSLLAIAVLLVNLGQASVFAAIASVSVVIVYLAYLMVTVPALIHRLRGGTSLSHGKPVMDLGRWGGIPVNLVAVVMGGLLVVNIGWPRQEVYNPAGDSWFLQYFAVIFVALTLAVGTSPTGWCAIAKALPTQLTRWFPPRRSSRTAPESRPRIGGGGGIRRCGGALGRMGR